MHTAIDIILSTVTHPAFSAVTFLLGLLGGHWWALSRDRRKDYNAIAARIREALIEERQFGRISAYHRPAGMKRADCDAVRYYMSWWQRRQFDLAAQTYTGVKGEDGPATGMRGRTIPPHHVVLNTAIDELLKVLPLR